MHSFSMTASLHLGLVSKIALYSLSNKIKYYISIVIIQLLNKYAMGNKIAPLWRAWLASLGTYAKGVQFYCPSCTYLAISYCPIFPFLVHCVRSIRRKEEVINCRNPGNHKTVLFRNDVLLSYFCYIGVKCNHWHFMSYAQEPQTQVGSGHPLALFRKKRLALNEMFQRNASQFAIFYI